VEKINIEQALSHLLGHCDGARSRDNVGFNGMDASFARSCYHFLNKAGWLTEKQRNALAKLLPKYGGQLAKSGLELDLTLAGTARPEKKKPTFFRSLDLNEAGSEIVIAFSYDEAVVAIVQKMSGRRFEEDTKIWYVPFDVVNARACQELPDFEISDRLAEEMEALFAKHAQDEVASRALDCDFEVSKTNEPLYPYQRAGVQFALEHGDKVLIADEPGLGKTWQAIGYLSENTQRPAVVICPASMKLVWKQEIERLLDGEKVAILNGQKDKVLPQASVYILNYDLAVVRKPRKGSKTPPQVGWLELLHQAGVNQTIILDESHKIKNPKAKRTRAITDFAETFDNILCLTGTPVLNRPIEMFTTLNMLRPETFKSYYSYAFRYCGAYKSQYGLVVNGSSNLDELKVKLAEVMVRRQKSEVLKELPPKTRSMVPVPLDNEREYKLVETDLIAWLKEQGRDVDGARRGAALQKIEYCKQVAVRGKLEAGIDWCKDFVENGEKLIIFATHKTTIKALSEAFGDCSVVVDGSVPLDERDDRKNRFQTDPEVKVFIGNIQAAGVGLTLHAASNVVFFELGWTPGEHDQAEDRAHRIGQKDSVNAWYLLAPGTIDETIARLIDAKRGMISQLLDKPGTKTVNIFNDLVAELFSR
jgi:SWI/SNF-related matrix-associated actin-dependent regulator 1 of chromatin subfamily A